jgi:hypothetical protein
MGVLQGCSPMLAIVAAAALLAQLRFVKLRICLYDASLHGKSFVQN